MVKVQKIIANSQFHVPNFSYLCPLNEFVLKIIIFKNLKQMKKNLFLAILCVLGLFGTLNAQVVTIDGTVGGYEASTSNQVPVYNNNE